jgi:Na+-translocating ferredoxin:NAD+ oxidoreductase RnfG subunit
MTSKSFWQHNGHKLLVSGVVIALLGAAIFGQLTQKHSSYETYLPGAIPQAKSFTQLKTSGSTALFQANDVSGKAIGFVTAAQGPGYGGPMSVLVAWTTKGVITSVTVPQHHEDLPWWNALVRNKFFSQYIGRSFSDPLQLKTDIDATTGSTISSNGVAVGVRSGRLLLADYLGQPYTGPPERIQIGRAEIALVLGMLAVILARTLPWLRHRSWPRFVTLTYSFLVLGIWLAIPLSLTNIASWLVGYSPHLQTFLVMYILVFGIIGLAVLLGKNYYCFWLCPYVAIQEFLHFVFGGNVHPNPKWFKLLVNVRYLLLFVAVFLVLLLKNPSVSVFEPWNVVFSLKGTAGQWVLTVFALVSAIFVYNFWCHYLCPVKATLDVVIKIRKGVFSIWPKKQTPINPKTSPTSL